MKKTLALVLALAMIFSTITVAFAEDTLGEDAQICADLGMLKGETGTVDAAYVATAPTRLQAAVMFLRLKGLEAEALAFTGEDNFADGNIAWAEGANLLAYLKANPQLGWIGDGTNFNPTGAMTAQAYYKVLLEALGYKQNTAEVVGDFAYADVIAFAAEKGLAKVAAVENYTVNDLAIATVEALKLNVKGGEATLIASLVEAGKVEAAKAITAGLYEDAATTEAKLDAVIASANDKVEVTFDADVAAAFAENAANYNIVVKGSKTALEVTAAKAVSGTIVELTTAAQTGGTAYTLTVGEVSKNFAGIAKITGAPAVDKVTCIDTNTVEVVFTKAMDRASVEDVANYTLSNNATVKAAELWIDQDDSRMTVKLTTEGVANNKIYKLTVSNVNSADQVALKSASKSFAGVTDTKAPTIKGNVKVMNNQRFQITFDDKHGVDETTVEDIANWDIEGLTITKITAKDVDGDDYGYLEVVEVDTEPMDANHKYTVTISNLADGSSSKNVISKALTKTFYGVAVDKNAPKPGTISVLGDNMVEIVFSETNRLDYTTATDVSNYTFNEGLQVLSASILRESKPDTELGRTVVLTTSTMDKDTTYKITIENVADEFGNVMTKVNNRAIARSKGADIKPPAVKKVVWVDKNTVEVHFDERLDVNSANDPANFSINGDIGAVKKAELSASSGYMRVDLTTPDLTNNKAYKITINGVKDRLGNEIANYVVGFTSGMATADTTRPEIENIVAVNEDEVRVTFDEAVKATQAIGGNEMSFKYGTTTITADIVGIAAPAYTIDDNTTVVFKTDAKITTTDEIEVQTLTNVMDLHNNAFVLDTSDKPTFYGNTDDNDDPEVVAVDQLDMKTLQVTFSEPVLVPATLISDGITFNLVVDEDDDQTTDALSVVTMTHSTGLIPYEKEFEFNFSTITDYVGKASEDTKYEYTAYLDDEDSPVIDYVEAVNTGKIQVHFNEDLSIAGTYNIKDSDNKTVSVSISAAIDGTDKNIVNLTFDNSKLKPGDVYTLIPKTAAKDIAGNSLEDLRDLEFDFVASSVEVNDYIKGVSIVDAKKIKVAFTMNTDFSGSATGTAGTDTGISVKADASGAVEMVDYANVDDTDKDLWIVVLKTPLLDDIDYKVVTNGEVGGTFTIEGVLGDGGLEFDDTTEVITFSGFDDTYVVHVVYEGVTSAVAWDPTLVGGVANGFDATSVLDGFAGGAVPTDAPFTVEVRRAAGEAVLYSKEFTR